MATSSLPERVSALEEAVTALQNLPKELAAFRAEADARFAQIDSRFGLVDARFDRLERLVSDEVERLYSRMLMLNEDLITRISTLNEGRNRGGTPSPRPGQRKPKR